MRLPGLVRWPELRRVFAARFAELSSAEIDVQLLGSDACYAPVISLRDAPANAQLQARRTFITVDGVVQPAPAPRFSATCASVRRPPPRPGEHTEEVLREWLE